MTIKIPLVWAAVLLFLASEGVLLYEFHNADDKWRQTITFGASIVAGAFALYGYMKGIEERRRTVASRLIERWNDPSISSMRKTIREITEGLIDASPAMRSKKGVEQPGLEMRRDIVGILALMEEMCLAIRTSAANEEILRRYFEPVVIGTFESLRPWIDNERSLDHEPTYYVEIESVCENWKKLRTRSAQTIR